MILSGGQLVLADTTPSFANTYYAPSTGLNLTDFFSSYQAIYKNQLWVYVVVRKLALGTARLPLKVYRRGKDGRTEERDNPYAVLLNNPNQHMNPKHFWEWTVSTLNVFGEAIWLKVRGRDGKPAELWPVHPINIAVKREDDGTLSYIYHLGNAFTPKFVIPQSDIVHFKNYHPDTTLRGLSPLEPLRMTLLNEDSARRASTALWKNGARPSVTLSHPGKLSTEAMARLKANWDAIHSSVDNFAKTAILEEGMKPEVLSLNAEELQYIETRKLNREEVVAAYDVPPPVVHILDRATFSNITEQMRSLYRDTMAPRLQLLEADLDFQLRPDFEDDTVYAEFLMDEVLRGDFESRMDAYSKAIGYGVLEPAEAREAENRPFVEGSDRLFINAANIPIDEVSSRTSPSPPAEDVPGDKPAVPEPQGDTQPKPKLPPAKARLVTDRAGRREALADVDPQTLVMGLNGDSELVLSVLADCRDAGASVAAFCRDIWNLVED